MIQQTELFKKVTKYNDHMENNGLSRLALTSREVSKGQIISKCIFHHVTSPKMEAKNDHKTILTM